VLRSRTPAAPTESGHRRPGLIPGRRFALAAAAATALLVSGSGAALADPSDMILSATIYKSGAQPTTESITAGSLESRAQQCPVYPHSNMAQHGRNGEFSDPGLGANTWALATVLSCLAAPVQAADATGGVTVFSAGTPESGPDSTLTTQDLASHSDFNDPGETPVVEDDGTTREYLRPWRGGSDENALDHVFLTGGPISVSVFEGNPISVTANASPTTASEGGTVSFTASASGAGNGVSYQWSFGGGASSSTEQNPQVTFDSGGVWTVSLLVTDDNGDAGHAQLTETVTSSSSTTPTTPGTVTTGPANSSGTTPNGGAGPPTSGGGPPARKPTHQPTSTHSSPTTGTPKKDKNTTTTQTSTTPAAGSSGGSGSPGSGSGSSGSGSSGSGSTGAGAPASATTPKSTATTPAAPKAPARPAPPVPGAPRVVTGQLISAVVPVPEGASPLVHVVAAAPATAPALNPPKGSSPLSVIASVLAVLLLLAAGAGRELRGRGRRLPRWFPVHARA
jgi:hypothetical protein